MATPRRFARHGRGATRGGPPTRVLLAGAFLALLGSAGEGGAQIILAGGGDTEVTEDGLHRVHPDAMASAWVKPGLDLRPYRRVFLMPSAVQFRHIPQKRYTIRTMETADSFPVNDTDQAMLRRLFAESTREALTAVRSYEFSDRPGRDVLMVQALLTDVIYGVPPDISGSVVTNVRWAWEATLILELRDSMSDEVLARMVERERVDGPFFSAMVTALTPSIVDTWSRVLSGRLEELSDLSGRPDVSR